MDKTVSGPFVISGLEMFAVPHPQVAVCDYPGCKAQFPEKGLGLPLGGTRSWAARHGWVSDNDRTDYCPEHATTYFQKP